ncbi:NADPH:quinone reductase-like Zn-dependent oxidoreductase [Streptomyces pratensis]|nr:NADPH:quinone reductase-like Zn-dependent oxidoreductase [Streptomyces pratensis]
MRAVTTRPMHPGSLQVSDVPDPVPAAEEILVDGLALGIHGTDKEIAAGEYGWPHRDVSA